MWEPVYKSYATIARRGLSSQFRSRRPSHIRHSPNRGPDAITSLNESCIVHYSKIGSSTSELGQTQSSGNVRVTSALPSTTTKLRTSFHVSSGPIVLQKS